MSRELLSSFTKGCLTKELLIEDIFTDLGSSLYSYMIMLSEAGRERESKFYDSLRTKIFACRSSFNDTEPVLDKITEIHHEIRTAYLFLQFHKPAEATILESPENYACGLIGIIRDYEGKR